MIEPRHLRVLRAVSRTGSFSAAARELGVSQPAVSQQMKALEQAAGTPLVVRAGRVTRLTEAGEALARHATGILAGLTAAEEEVAAIIGLRAGRVRMVSFPSGGSALVPAAIARMRAANPGTRVLLEEAETPRSVELLRSGDCEVALAFRYVGGDGESEAAEWEDLAVTPLLADRLVGLLPESHPLAPTPGGSGGAAGAEGGREFAEGGWAVRDDGVHVGGDVDGGRGGGRPAPIPLSALAGESWVAGSPRRRRHLVEVCAAAGFSPRVDFATDDPPAVVGLVGAGLGVAMLPEPALRSLRLSGVALVDVHPYVRREVVALTLPDLARVPAVEALLAQLVGAARA